MEYNKIIVYHGTDAQYANDIIKNGFKCKTNKEHWLGNGIYFYLDYNTAKWWANTPKVKFGSQIKNPIVIKAKINSNRNNTFDTRIYDDYMYLLELFEEFLDKLCKNGKVNNHISIDRLRCMFFDWVYSEFEDIEIFIAGFEKRKECNNSNDLKYKLKVPYIEYQMCVFNNDLITEKERMNNYEEN